MQVRRLLMGFVWTVLLAAPATADTLNQVQRRGQLVWGADAEGGGPYVYADPGDPRRKVGFEVELAALLARELKVKPVFFQGPWENLNELLGIGQVDTILNGYELTASRARLMDHTRPYYVYETVLLARRDDSELKSWNDLRRSANQATPRIGVLGTSAARTYLETHWRGKVQIVNYDSNTDSMGDVQNGKLDATLVDLPVAIFYRDRYPGLRQVGEPVGRGYYVIYVQQGERRLREALNAALARLLENGELQRIYERYGLWSKAQEQLVLLAGRSDAELGIRDDSVTGWRAVRWSDLRDAALLTVGLACASMPLAILLGLLVAVGRLYGPPPLRWLLTVYVEVLRGTPLMLQLFVIFFVLPAIGVQLRPIPAAIAGLAINYSAYEAEIYRAGLQAIPRGQMEAALALGMSPVLALRRILIPQAVRIVVPPVTNDFIAMFKDTSVCSVITVVELTKEYNIQRNDTGATLQLAVVVAVLYLLMSVPLAHLSSWLEKRLGRQRSVRL